MSFVYTDKSRFQKPFQILGIKFAPLNVPFERRLQTIAALIWSSIIVIGFPLGCTIFLYLLWTSQVRWILWPYIAWIIYDFNTPFNGGRNINGSICLHVRNWQIWKYFKDYFPVKVIKTADLDSNKGYLLGSHPHGFMASGVFAAFATNDKDLKEIYPNIKSRSSMEIALRNGKGLIHILIVGGAMEAMDLGDHKDVLKLYLDKRKGFIKWLFFEHPWLKKIQLVFERIFGFVPLIFFGRGIFQYSLGILPLRVPLHVVIGYRAIAVMHRVHDKVKPEYMSLVEEAYQEFFDLDYYALFYLEKAGDQPRKFGRFVGRYGKPTIILSDNARPFVATNKQLQTLKNLDFKKVREENYSGEYIEWKFSFLEVPWTNAVTERMNDSRWEQSISLNMLQYGRNINTINTPSDKVMENVPCSEMWITIKRILNSFWSILEKEFLQELRIPSRWIKYSTFQKKKILQGEVVLLKPDTLEKNQLKIGKVAERFCD
ncbi:MOGAT1 [Lepeophtheirus salmonis]|uniref:Acyltransferase n=1 Tax=Lepeophtheirus salmonis TaxID=72036 RepID=A0A7R8CYB5_LEPSM|nr:MOGAT1 [Lepeophtheirus salmonis]CAF2968403.1 MOGAT1 [Lepeophtheirus salmonis]